MQTAIKHLRRKDKVLAGIIKPDSPTLKYRKRPHFEALVQIILNQQLSGKAAQTIFDRVCHMLPKGKVTIPAIKNVSDSQLRKAGMSHAKIKAVRNVVTAVDSGALSFRKVSRMSDDDALISLTAIKGIGNWTARIFLMFVLHREDLFPVGDGGIVRAMRQLYGENIDSERMEEIAEKWRPYRTVACWYLWNHLDNGQ